MGITIWAGWFTPPCPEPLHNVDFDGEVARRIGHTGVEPAEFLVHHASSVTECGNKNVS